MNTNLKTSSSPCSKFLQLLVICSLPVISTYSSCVEARHFKPTKVNLHYQTKPPKPTTPQNPTPKHRTLFSPTVRVSSESLARYIKTIYKKPALEASTIAHAITQVSKSVNLDPLLLTAIAAKESGFRSTVNSRGNYGLMQIDISEHFKEIHDAKATGKMATPYYNILVGATILKTCLDSTAHGNLRHALSLYNRGCSSLDKSKKLHQGNVYATRILSEARTVRTWLQKENS